MERLVSSVEFPETILTAHYRMMFDFRSSNIAESSPSAENKKRFHWIKTFAHEIVWNWLLLYSRLGSSMVVIVHNLLVLFNENKKKKEKYRNYKEQNLRERAINRDRIYAPAVSHNVRANSLPSTERLQAWLSNTVGT